MANSRTKKLEDLQITREEIETIGNALKKEEFRKLLVDYCEEISDPANRKQYEDEITELEKERGVNVTFIHPTPAYVIKTSVDGSKKAFINVCHNENVGKPTSTPGAQGNSRGLQWSIPHTLAPPREDTDKKGNGCIVYDVVFHPDTIYLADRNKSFKAMVTSTACDSVQSNFNVTLDTKNLKFPKLNFKGSATAAVVRKPIDNYIGKSEEDIELLDKLCPYPYDNLQSKPKVVNPPHKNETNEELKYAKPKYLIKYRSGVEMQDFTDNFMSKINATIPNELIIEVDLPLLKSTADVELDVTEKHVCLVSEKPAKYKLDLTLPYSVMEDSGNAKFDKSTRKLVITMPVKRKNILLSEVSREDSGVDSDQYNSPLSSSVSDEGELIKGELVSEIKADEDVKVCCENDFRTTNSITKNSFLDSNVHYLFPDSSVHAFENTLAFTLHVKNVEPDSVEKCLIDSNHGIHLKFSTISSGFFPTYYSFCIKFCQEFDSDDLSIETWDNNLIIQIPFSNCDTPLTSYLAGINEDSLLQCTVGKHIFETVPSNDYEEEREDDNIETNISATYSENENQTLIEITNTENSDKNIQKKTSGHKFGDKCTKRERNMNNIVFEKSNSYSESSGDELSLSQSPSKSKGILKHKRSSGRNIMCRSVSESSMDDMTLPNSFDNYNMGSDICIPEEKSDEDHGIKKTVRFSDNITKQLFRSNSSILGQRKKNQRKNRNKKRALERRYSESEISENDERKEVEKVFEKKRERGFSESELSEIEDAKECMKNLKGKHKQRHDSGIGSDNDKEKCHSSNRHSDNNRDSSIVKKKGAVSNTSKSENGLKGSYKMKQDYVFKSDLIFDLDM